MREAVRGNVNGSAAQRIGGEHGAFLHHANLLLRAGAGGAVGPAASHGRGELPAGPVHYILLVRRKKRKQPPAFLHTGSREEMRGFREMRLTGTAPATGSLAAEAGIGQQTQGGFDAGFPDGIGNGKHAPEPGVRRELQAGGLKRLGNAGKTIHRGGGTHGDPERRAAAQGHQALAFAIDGPARFIHQAAFHDFERNQLRALQIEPARERRRPRRFGRRHQARLAHEREQRTETDGWVAGRRGGRFEPLGQPAERAHGMGDSGIERVAVINHIDPLPVARAMPHTPRARGPQLDFNQTHSAALLRPIRLRQSGCRRLH